MAFQPSVTQYFVSKKRPASDVLLKKNNSSKVLVLDSLSPHDTQENNEHKIDQSAPKIIYAPIQKNGLAKSGQPNVSVKKSMKAVNSSKSSIGLIGKKASKTSHDTNQADIRKTLINLKNTVTNTGEEDTKPNSEEQGMGSENAFPCTPTKSQQNVAFVKKSILSPIRIMPTSSSEEQTLNNEVSEKELNHVPEKELENESKNEEDNFKTVVENKSEKEAENQQIVSRTNLLRKELNLGQIKAKLTRSSRLEEMKQALERINQSKAELANIQEKLKKPTLEKFESVELEVPYASPMKTPVKKIPSPCRSGSKFTPSRLFNEPPPPKPVASPLKSPFKSPAFQRYQTLVTEGRSALTLPFKYRALAEMFHCVDTVVSMFNNRKETVTFAKLKPAVEEMKKRALTEYQLGQIKTVFPQGFEFRQEKIHKFGSTMQSDKYDLVITPILSTGDKNSARSAVMTPTCILERKRSFYKTLLDMTKDYHEEFLTGLDPPMHISRDRLTRWHPNFDVDGVPDIISSALPQPPNVEKITTAKDVLERSRSLFTANPRMQRALQKVSELNESSSPNTTSAATTLSTDSLLKGIPKCLLEKVRAKQAAKAMEAMTRTPSQAKEAVRLTRLPEIARIIRNLFVAEKKSVLPRDLVLKKLDDSYRENLTISDLDDHVKLLSDHTPGWMTFCNIRKTDYIRLSKNADMLRIMRRLESLAAEKEF